MRYSGIYMLYWHNNDYYYIGQSVNMYNRYMSHLINLKKGQHKNFKIQNIYNKYGRPLVHCVLKCDKSELDKYEQLYIDEGLNDNYSCNIIKLASSTRGRKYRLEIRMKMLERGKLIDYKGEKNPFYGRKHTEETKRKISEMKKGNKYPKLSEAKRGTIISEETRKKLRDIRSNGNVWKSKIVLDTQTGVYYVSAKEVADLYNINHGTLMAKLCGNRINNTKFIYTS